MTTVINNPGENRNNDASGVGVLIGAIIVVLALVIAFILLLPYIRERMTATTSTPTTVLNPTINVQVPEGSTTTVQ